ncbi:MAG: hydrogenase expression/formation protein HypE [Bacteroidales bacterium]|nr:hydrogenase expression/formation protein HypE [Bacteroidales bacterium]
MSERILLSHGSGGELTHRLIEELFVAHFDNDQLRKLSDSSLLGRRNDEILFTTDSYVVDPIFFPGGDIGKLSVCGTVNDLAVAGAQPAYLSAGFIIEEGFPMEDLRRVVASMAREAKQAGVQIVTGDTKVVNKGKADKIFINTSGVGFLHPHLGSSLNGRGIKEGDKIIVNGHLGEHGLAVLAAREDLQISSQIHSDCASLNGLINKILNQVEGVRMMRDLTRGGLATVMCELAGQANIGIHLEEDDLPAGEQVKGLCEMLGLDPLYLANEGKFVAMVDARSADKMMDVMRADPLGRNARVIGEVVEEHPSRVVMQTRIGGRRIIEMLTGEQLPRIC